MHRLGVGMGQGERRRDAAGLANRSEQIGVFVALICGLARPGSASCPLPNLAILLRASSWNQISTGVISGRLSRWALSVREKFF